MSDAIIPSAPKVCKKTIQFSHTANRKNILIHNKKLNYEIDITVIYTNKKGSNK